MLEEGPPVTLKAALLLFTDCRGACRWNDEPVASLFAAPDVQVIYHHGDKNEDVRQQLDR